MNPIRLVGIPLVWAIQLVVKVPTILLGLVMVALLYPKRHTPLEEMPFWSKPWVNPEDWHGGHRGYDGSLPTWWKERMGDGFWPFYKYHAIRNPADGLRNYKSLQLWIDKDKLRYYTPMYLDRYETWYTDVPGVYWYFTWQGLYGGFKLLWIRKTTHSEIKFGFRAEPRDAHHELPENSTRRHYGASFASKLILSREN